MTIVMSVSQKLLISEDWDDSVSELLISKVSTTLSELLISETWDNDRRYVRIANY